MEAVFGYAESEASMERAKAFECMEQYIEEETLPATGTWQKVDNMVSSKVDNDEAAGTEKGEGASALKKKKRQAAPIPKVYRCPKLCDLPDKVKL